MGRRHVSASKREFPSAYAALLPPVAMVEAMCRLEKAIVGKQGAPGSNPSAPTI